MIWEPCSLRIFICRFWQRKDFGGNPPIWNYQFYQALYRVATAITSCDMRPLGLHIHRIEGLTPSHEQAVALAPAKAQVGADLGQHDLTNAVAIGGKDVHPVKTLTAPASGGPDIPVDVSANTVRHPLHSIQDHRSKGAAMPQPLAID